VTHQFNTKQPRGILHRAFSVFLFDEQGRLLLQQRASTKITFPNVWTNTCCSHPLHGYSPTEVDTPEDVANGTTPGVKRAAVRKLKHELGIEADQLPVDKFKFLTRLHYWAADTVTHGPSAEWGEHEIDYVLFFQGKVDTVGNPEEVDDLKYVTKDELKAMMDPSSGLLWSPWFRVICDTWLWGWWADLEETLTTDKHVDLKSIAYFDPPMHHEGIYRESRVGEAPMEKQGAYGKLVTHSESKLSQIARLDEVFGAVWFTKVRPMPGHVDVMMFGDELKDDVEYCDDVLGKVSRSFAMVIRQLPRELVLDILIFYIVLRALDTVEDDTTAFPRPGEKIMYLNAFHETALVNDKWKMVGVGEGDEAHLLENFGAVARVFAKLPAASQEVIADITKRMGAGMAEFVEKDMGQGTKTTEEYNLYCHYVAGLVGEGLSRLFVATGFENQIVATDLETSNSMGLFLQKTNIIRDYLEDYVDKRAWWPQDVWQIYAKSGDLGEFAQPDGRPQAMACLNHMVTDALELIPECIKYLERLNNDQVFRFCAIPQVMAIATLDKCFNNGDVFTGVVKVRKGLAVKMIMESGTMKGIETWFNRFAMSIKAKIDPNDPSAARTAAACDVVCKLCADNRPIVMRGPGFLPVSWASKTGQNRPLPAPPTPTLPTPSTLRPLQPLHSLLR